MNVFNFTVNLTDYFHLTLTIHLFISSPAGKLKLCMEDAQDILSAADFLCIDTVKQYCSQFLHHRITLENCICVKFLAEKYNLHELGQEALTVATSSTVAVFETEDALEFPFEYVSE